MIGGAQSCMVLGSCRFGVTDQDRFAALSGDRNPLHLDPLAARRTQAGAPAVHGMHAVLWALETLAGAGLTDAGIAALRVRFRKFIPLDRDVRLELVRHGPPLHGAVVAEGMTTIAIELELGTPLSMSTLLSTREILVPESPFALSLEDLPGRSGFVAVPPAAALAAFFPRLAIQVGLGRLATLARLSALVGMVCPGLHSVFNGFEIRITEDTGAAALSYQVDEVDERFRLARMHVRGGGLEGTVTAIVRHPPVVQPTLADLRPRVQAGEFRPVTALVIGGSRGLGAVTARMIAAGGGRVILTYVRGEQEARAVAEEMEPNSCQVLYYDVRSPAVQQLAGLTWQVNQLHYFATPRIFRQKARTYARELFAEFCDIYVDGFEAACTALLAQTEVGLAAFYPSSIAVTERPLGMTEYAMAKAAGEILCEDLQRNRRGLHICVSRLPRILTDQTATGAATGSDPVTVMLPILRAMMSGCKDR